MTNDELKKGNELKEKLDWNNNQLQHIDNLIEFEKKELFDYSYDSVIIHDDGYGCKALSEIAFDKNLFIKFLLSQKEHIKNKLFSLNTEFNAL